jgi:D-alanyl-D-alanine dipeptidase
MATRSPHLSVLLAYAQDELVWSGNYAPITVDKTIYNATPRELRVNKFGLSYKRNATLWLHETLARIITAAADHLHTQYGWRTVLYDGLRTVDGAYNLYVHAHDTDMSSGLLSMPGTSAHNKGLAVDSMMIDAKGLEVDMGGHFDHLDMDTNGRNYTGDAITPAAIENRRIREAAFLRGAFSQGLIIAPLRNEFWDDRLPENHEDLWRVLDSAARVIGLSLLDEEDLQMRKNDRAAFSAKWESWNYAQFLSTWQTFFAGHETKLIAEIGTAMPPLEEKIEFYHGNFNPIYEDAMPAHLRISQPR